VGYFYVVLLVYKRPAENILPRLAMHSQNKHAPSTEWDLSFRYLSIEGKTLLNILAFFDPDAIPEWLLSNPKANATDPGLEFLSDSLR
jgi:hypothetical protein